MSGSYYVPAPYASSVVELRAAVFGPVPRVRHLSYRATANVAFSSGAPYAAGPVSTNAPQNPTQQLVPIDPFRAHNRPRLRFAAVTRGAKDALREAWRFVLGP